MGDYANRLRLLPLEIADGPTQLARTEAMMDAIGANDAPPTLRLYTWSEPVVILGVGQPAADIDLDACRASGYHIVRRTGGGTAVYHDADEVSVDLILPSDHPLAFTDVHAGYAMFAGLLNAGLQRMGIQVDTVSVERAREMRPDPEMRPICFASISPFEFEVQGRKLNGLCQIRRRTVVAYQTAIYRRFSVEPLLRAIVHENGEIREQRKSSLAAGVTDLATAGAPAFDYVEYRDYLARICTERFGLDVYHAELTRQERDRAQELVAEKYANQDWTFRR